MRSIYLLLLSIIFLFSILIPVQAKPFARSFLVSDTVNINDYVVLTVLVEGGKYHNTPQLNQMPDFTIISTGQESQYTLIGAKMTNRTKFTYLMKAKKAGMFKVGEGNVKVDNSELHLYPVTVTVLGASKSPTPSYTPPSTPQASTLDLSSSFGNDDIFFEAVVDNSEPYENQQVIYTASIYFRVNINNTDLQTPAFKDFVVEPLATRNQFKTIINGAYYNVYQQAFAIIPTKPGEIDISPSYITGRMLVYNDPMDRIFGNYQYESFKLKSKSIKMKVKSLPNPPKGFKNSVGDFEVSTDISKTTLKTGESAKLKLKIIGKGNITNIQEPEFDFDKKFRKNFKIYKSTPEVNITDKTNYIAGSKVFTYDLVALTPGEYVVPQAELICYSPEHKRYRQLRSDTIKIKVLPGDDEESLDLTSSVQEDIDDDQIAGIDGIIDIYRSNEFVNDRLLGVKEYVFFLVIFILPIILLVMLSLYLKRQNYVQKNIHKVKSKNAFKTARKKLNKMKAYLNSPNNKQFFDMLDNIIKEYIGDKFNVPAGTLTSLEIEKMLKANNVSRNNVLLLSEIVKLCEELQYSSRDIDIIKNELALSDTLRILKVIEKEIKI